MNIDDIFADGGLAVALMHGCELSVELTGKSASAVKIDKDDLTCRECGSPIDVPRSRPAFAIAFNKRFNDGLCADCDPVE